MSLIQLLNAQKESTFAEALLVLLGKTRSFNRLIDNTEVLRNSIVAQWSPSQGSPTANNTFIFRDLQTMGGGATGTPTSATIANTSLFTSYPGTNFNTGAVAASYAGWRGFNANPHFTRGNAAGVGGFKATFIFGTGSAATVANEKVYVGLYNGSGALVSTTNPGAFLNVIGIGYDGEIDTAYQIYHNDGAGVATKIDLGTDFPIKTLSTAFIKVTLSCEPNNSQVTYTVKRVDTGATRTGILSSNLPANTMFLNATAFITNGTTALASTLKLFKVYATIGQPF